MASTDEVKKTHTSPPGTGHARTWQEIRSYMTNKYGQYYKPHELRDMELKWRRAFRTGGFDVGGE